MRIEPLAVIAVSLTTLAGCGAIQFDVEQALAEQTVQGSALGGLLPSLVPNPITLSVNVKAETEKRGTGPATAVYVKSLDFAATKNSGTFDFLDEAHVFIEGPNLPKIEIATAAPVGKGLTSLVFTIVPKTNLLPYVNAGATLTVTAKGRQPASDFTFDGKLIIDIRV